MITVVLKKELIRQAQERHPGQKLYPVHGHKKLMDCFNIIDGQITFWYNTKDESTHIIQMKETYERS